MTPCVPDAGSPRQPLEYGTMPVVRIIMSTFNGARFLPELLNSISQQTGVTVRWWIRDDGSTDSTREILVDASSHMDMQVSAGANNRTVLSVLDLFQALSLIHISEPTRLGMISYAVFCLKKKKKK